MRRGFQGLILQCPPCFVGERFTYEDLPMLRRITLLIPLLMTVSLSGCWMFMPPGGGGGGHGGGGGGGFGGGHGGGPGFMQGR